MADATEVAFVLAALVSDRQAFPDAAAHDLHQLLGHRIAAPNRSVLRYDRLQLLLSMLLENGAVPTLDDYQARRAAGAGSAPTASTLIAAYGAASNAPQRCEQARLTPGFPRRPRSPECSEHTRERLRPPSAAMLCR